MARYALQMWQAVLRHEALNKTEWYDAGLAAARWVARQQNPEDGGLPNRIVLQPTDNWDDLGTRNTIPPAFRLLEDPDNGPDRVPQIP